MGLLWGLNDIWHMKQVITVLVKCLVINKC